MPYIRAFTVYLTTAWSSEYIILIEIWWRYICIGVLCDSSLLKSHILLDLIWKIILFDSLFQTNDALVAPLLRLKDNNCHIEESERVLKKYLKYSELIILYEKKGLHKKGE